MVVLPILCKIAEYAQDANNKITTARQCLSAIMTIVIAILVAHFVDKAFYTIKQSSQTADNTITYFAIFLKCCLMSMIGFVFYKLRAEIKKESLLKMKTGMWAFHILALSLYFIWWTLYEVAYYFWMLDPNMETGLSDQRLVTLAVIELCFNSFSCLLGFLLFYMVEKMT